jgi:hypothetical protein
MAAYGCQKTRKDTNRLSIKLKTCPAYYKAMDKSLRLFPYLEGVFVHNSRRTLNLAIN